MPVIAGIPTAGSTTFRVAYDRTPVAFGRALFIVGAASVTAALAVVTAIAELGGEVQLTTALYVPLVGTLAAALGYLCVVLGRRSLRRWIVDRAALAGCTLAEADAPVAVGAVVESGRWVISIPSWDSPPEFTLRISPPPVAATLNAVASERHEDRVLTLVSGAPASAAQCPPRREEMAGWHR